MSLTNTTAAQRYCPKNSFHPSPPSRSGLDTTTSNTYVDLLPIVSPSTFSSRSEPARPSPPSLATKWETSTQPRLARSPRSLPCWIPSSIQATTRSTTNPTLVAPGPQQQTYSTIFKTALRASIHHHRHIHKSTVPSPWYQRTGTKKVGKLGRHSCFGSIP